FAFMPDTQVIQVETLPGAAYRALRSEFTIMAAATLKFSSIARRCSSRAWVRPCMRKNWMRPAIMIAVVTMLTSSSRSVKPPTRRSASVRDIALQRDTARARVRLGPAHGDGHETGTRYRGC